MATRRWFYLIPAEGEPRALVHAIERQPRSPARREDARTPGRLELEAGLADAARRAAHASRWSTRRACAIPYVSRVDAGTIELVRDHGVDVVSSGDLIQQFEARWNDAAIATHRAASETLYRIKDRAFDAVAAAAARRRRRRPSTTSSSRWWAGSRRKGWSADSAPCVAAQENAGNPHYLPTADAASRRSARTSVVLLDLWGKLADAGRGLCRHHAGWASPGRTCPTTMAAAFAAVARRARRGGRRSCRTAAARRPRGARLGSRPGRARRC